MTDARIVHEYSNLKLRSGSIGLLPLDLVELQTKVVNRSRRMIVDGLDSTG